MFEWREGEWLASVALEAKVAIGNVRWIIHEASTVTLLFRYFLKLLLTSTAPLLLSLSTRLFFTARLRERRIPTRRVQWKHFWPMVNVLTRKRPSVLLRKQMSPSHNKMMQSWVQVFTLYLISCALFSLSAEWLTLHLCSNTPLCSLESRSSESEASAASLVVFYSLTLSLSDRYWRRGRRAVNYVLSSQKANVLE